MIHELKLSVNYFYDVAKNLKRFEVRKNDRNYNVGDVLELRAWDSEKKEYELFKDMDGQMPATIKRRITYILKGGEHGIDPDYVVLGMCGDCINCTRT